MEKETKRIEVVEMRVGDIKTNFGNPRKISKEKVDELKRSLERYGDFGIFIIDEEDNVIAGNQRREILVGIDPDTVVTCKRLIGYTKQELRAINIKDNTHAGEWDLDLLAEWTADLEVDLGTTLNNNPMSEQTIPAVSDMALINHEKYDYVVLVCRNEIDYNDLVARLGLVNKKVRMSDKNGRRSKLLKARATWYDASKFKDI